MVTLSTIIATIGRPTLEAALDSVLRQTLLPGDQIVVVRDSFEDADDRERVRDRIKPYVDAMPQLRYCEVDGGYHYYGVPQTNAMMSLLSADFFVSFGDDDIVCDGAWQRLREAIGEHRDRPVIFQWLAPWNEILWDTPRLVRSRVSGSCLAAPVKALVPFPLGRYVEIDFDWMLQIVARCSELPYWLQDVLTMARPQDRNGSPAHEGAKHCDRCKRVIYLEDAVDGLCCWCLKAPAQGPLDRLVTAGGQR